MGAGTKSSVLIGTKMTEHPRLLRQLKRERMLKDSWGSRAGTGFGGPWDQGGRGK